MRLHREKYLAHLLCRGSDREIFVEQFGPLIGLEAEWRRQGAAENELTLDAFDFDSVDYCWLGDTGPRGDHAPAAEFDSPEYSIQRDAMGRRMKLIKSTATLPLPINYPVETMDEWQQVRHGWPTIPSGLPTSDARTRSDGRTTVRL